jgi:hypothetical protein
MIHETPSFEVRVGKPVPRKEDDKMVLSTLWIEITAAGGYRQTVPITLGIDLSK